GTGGSSVTVALQNVTLADALAEVERRMISEALRKHNGNISRAARELGLTRRGLYLKLDRLEMSPTAYPTQLFPQPGSSIERVSVHGAMGKAVCATLQPACILFLKFDLVVN